MFGLLLETVGELLADDFDRNLAGTEAGNPRLADKRLLDVLHDILYFLGVQLDLKLNLALVLVLRARLHICSLSPVGKNN